MSQAIIKNSTLSGTVKAPSSKSAAHRILICAALSKAKCYIKNVSDSFDMRATISCLEALGAKIKKSGTDVFLDATAFAKENSKEHYTLNCNESGTTLRVMIPICAALGLNVTFVGSGRLPTRPLDEYLKILPSHGVNIEMGENFLPLTISGKLTGDTFSVSPKVSSQYVSGLLFALSLLENDTKLMLDSELVGGQYVDITLDVMKKFSVNVEKTDNTYFVKGGQKYLPQESYLDENKGIKVEGDWSQAAFFLCGGALSGDIKVTGLDINSKQGDKYIVDILKALGADIKVEEDYIHVKKSELKGADINAIDTPDLVPVVSVLSSFAKGTTNIKGVSRLKFKESDRLKSTADMINNLGGDVSYTDDCITINGKDKLLGGVVDSYNDHRIVMSSSIAALRCEKDTTILDADAINKSYSDFFVDYNSVGGKADVIMG